MNHVGMSPDGDVVVLRLRTSRVLGVGVVVGPYTWCDEFGDVDGWDLQHVRGRSPFWTPVGLQTGVSLKV